MNESLHFTPKSSFFSRNLVASVTITERFIEVHFRNGNSRKVDWIKVECLNISAKKIEIWGEKELLFSLNNRFDATFSRHLVKWALFYEHCIGLGSDLVNPYELLPQLQTFEMV